MKIVRFLCVAFVALLLVASIGGVEKSRLPPAWPQPQDFIAGQLVIDLKTGGELRPAQFPEIRKTKVLEESGRFLIKIALTGLDPATETLLALNRMLYDANVTAAELDYRVAIALEPNDPHYADQWHLRRIEAPAAWNATIGDAIIAIVDTGVDANHPDLQFKVLPGVDFINGDNNPTDDQGHGTHVAGIAGAATNNGRGVAGVCWKCPILPVKSLDRNGAGGHSQIAAGIRYAADHGARVINMSFGGPYTSATLRDAIAYARQQDVLLVAAAGNAGGTRPLFPGAYDEVMAVAATDADDEPVPWTQHGDWISLAAPGVSIWSTVRGGDYQAWSGTSMSAPQVAGAGGLLAGAWPGATGDEIRRALEDGTRELDPRLGAGLLDIAAALDIAPAPTATPGNGREPSSTATPTSTATATPTGAADELVALIDEERDKRGLNRLAIDTRLIAAAERHTQDMRSSGFCGHAGSDGSSPERRMREAGYPDPLFEIVACGYIRPQALMRAILGCVSPGCGDPSPRDRILSELVTDIGVAERAGYWTIDLGGTGTVRPPTPTSTVIPTATATATATATVTATPEPEGFWMWCWDVPLRCEEREP